MQLLSPTLVDVCGADGATRPALLLARRGDRRYVQVSHAAGDNRLRWVPASDVQPATVRAASGLVPAASVPGASGAVALSGPRAQR